MRRTTAERLAVGAVLLAAAIAAAAPLLLGAVVGITDPSQYAREGLALPRPPSAANASALFEDPRTFAIPILVTVAAGALIAATQTVSSVLAAYALALLTVRGRRVLLVALAAAYAAPPVTTIIPLYSAFAAAGLSGTFWALVLPFMLSSPYAVVLLVQWMRGIPRELIDAARLDGAGHRVLLGSIVAPLTRPAIAIVALVGFVSVWNSYLWPRAIAGTQLPQVQVALAALQTQYDSNWTLVMAAASLSMIPPVAIALALHRPLTRSIDMGDLR